MKTRQLTLLTLLISLSTAASASVPGNAPTALAQRLESELTNLVQDAEHRGSNIDSAALTRIEAEVDAGSAQWMQGRGRAEDTAKLVQVRGLLANARRYGELRQQGTPTKLPYTDLAPGLAIRASKDANLGAKCANPLDLAIGTPLAAELSLAGDPGDALWVRVAPSANGRTAVSTLGSIGDVDIAVFTACESTQPVLANDDYYGLQALAPLPSPARSAYLVRVGNRDAARPVRARIEAILASGFSGKVSVDPAGSVSTAGLIVSYFTSISGYYVTATNIDSGGNYSLTTYADGTYYARTGTGYSQSGSLLHEAYGDVPCANATDYYSLSTCRPGQPAPITVSGGQTTTGVDFVLGLGRAISFRMTSESGGSPLVGASANLSGPSVNFGPVYADSAGRITFTGLRPDVEYFAAFSAEGFRPESFDNVPCSSYCQQGQGTPIVIPTGAPYFLDLAVALTPTRQLVVHVRDQPSASYGATVNLLHPSGQMALSGNAYYSGGLPGWRKVTFTDPTVGTYYLQAGYVDASFWRIYPNVDCLADCQSLFGQATPIVVTSTPGTQEYFIEPRPFPAVQGNVIDQASGAPVSVATAYLIPVSAGGSQGSMSIGASGAYRFNYVRPGSYLVAVLSPQHVDVAYPDAPCTYGGNYYYPVCPNATPVAVAATQNAFQFDFSLTPSGRVAGLFTVDGAASSAGVQMRLLRADGTTATGVLERTSGRYSLGDIDPGEYRIVVEDSSLSYGQIFPGVNCTGPACLSSMLGQPITVGQSALTDIDFDLRLKRGGKGRVLDASTGQPLAGVVVDMWAEGFSGTSYVRSGVTNADGRFALQGSDSGATSYRLATSVGSGYINEVYNNVACPLGPAYFNLCNLMQGVALPALHPIDGQGISFRLTPIGSDGVFADGMED